MPDGIYTPERLVRRLRQLLSLREPQKVALEILLDIVENHLELSKEADVVAQLEIVKESYEEVEDFERDFPSLCFALATGVGKTRLMGTFISYLYLSNKSRHFMLIAPSTTIYQKLITDFTPGTPKYVFKGLSEFVSNMPVLVTGDDWEKGEGVKQSTETSRPIINIFNVDKINRDDGIIKKLQETIGDSYYNYLAGLDDLVLLMDEAHRYRAKAGMNAIAELKPVLGLEVTATPKTTGSTPKPFKNVIYNYPLSSALQDGFVKTPTAVTLKDFNEANYDENQLQERKLKDAVHWHKKVKSELVEYAKAHKKPLVHPFILVVAADTTHSNKIIEYIRSDDFYNGHFRDKVIEIHSNQGSTESDEATRRLLELETSMETEIVIHVNKLKEGWDVSNLFTIVPLRTSASDILTEQTLGRGLRLPYGKRTGNKIIDSLAVIAHDKFEALIEESKKPDSILLETIELNEGNDDDKVNKSINIPSRLAEKLVGKSPKFEDEDTPAFTETDTPQPIFANQSEKKIICATFHSVRNNCEEQCKGGLTELNNASIRETVINQVKASVTVVSGLANGDFNQPIEQIVEKCLDEILEHTIEIPEIIIIPEDEVSFELNDFNLSNLNHITHQPVSDELLARNMHNQRTMAVGIDGTSAVNISPKQHLVKLLSAKNDIDYDSYSALLNKLVDQLITYLKSYLSNDSDLANVVNFHGNALSEFIYNQINAHKTSPDIKYHAEIKKGFKLLRPQVFSARGDRILNISQPAEPLSDTNKYVFTGLKKCAYPAQKFSSNPERQFAELLEDEARANIMRWMKPALNQFSIKYDTGSQYNPDFIIETNEEMIIAEVKARNEIDDSIVQMKADATAKWVFFVNQIAEEQTKKKWCYMIIPDDVINTSATLDGLRSSYTKPEYQPEENPPPITPPA